MHPLEPLEQIAINRIKYLQFNLAYYESRLSDTDLPSFECMQGQHRAQTDLVEWRRILHSINLAKGLVEPEVSGETLNLLQLEQK